MTLLVLETNHLLVYQNTTLKWAAQLPSSPVALDRIFLQTIKGAIVFLTEDGKLTCSYLGTEPSLFVTPPLHNREIDFEDANKELAQLSALAKSSYTNGKFTIEIRLFLNCCLFVIAASNLNEGVENDVVVTLSIAQQLETNAVEGANYLMCKVLVEIVPRVQLEEVQLAISLSSPLVAVPSEVAHYQNLSERVAFECFVYSRENSDVCSLMVDAVVTYITSLGVPRAVTRSKRLPLSLVMETCQAQKENEFKIVLNINQNSVPLNSLFPGKGEDGKLFTFQRLNKVFAISEFVSDDSTHITNNSVAFRGKSESCHPVTVLLAKSSVRYRLQCDSILPLNIVVQELIYRLKQYFAKNKDFAISYTSSLPISQILEYVNKHFDERQNVIKLEVYNTHINVFFILLTLHNFC